VDVLGIDVSKADFHACLLQGPNRTRKSFANSATGYRQLRGWLKNRKCQRVHACMEATGNLWLGLATALHEAGMVVSVVNPSRTVMFARSQLRRTKTDQVDAEMIADFCKTQKPGRWEPPAPEILELRGLLSYRRHMIEERVRIRQMATQIHVGKELSKLHAKQVKAYDQAIAALDRQLRAFLKNHQDLGERAERLTPIQGVGILTALALIAGLPVERLRNARAAAAYVGVTPSERQSGTSVHGKPRICKTGNAGLRRDLYLPAVVASRHNPILKAFADRLRERGKPPKAIVIAVMRKLVVLAYDVLKGNITIAQAA
jgi:transposase